jgi:hypothetical protein
MDWSAASMRVTVLLLAASVPLLVAGTAGLGGSVVLVAVLLASAAGLYAVRERLADLPGLLGHDVGAYAEAGWAAAAASALACLLALGATSAELQAVGGLLGLAGMANYFLRPVYYALVNAGRYVTRLTG